MYYSAARLVIAQAHIAIELEGPFREAPLTRSLRDVVVVFTHDVLTITSRKRLYAAIEATSYQHQNE